MLGSEICRVFGASHQIVALDIKEIDIGERERTLALLRSLQLDLIINAAAFVDVDACEREPDRAWRINAVGAQHVALAAADIGCRLVYISSDYVFDGNSDSDYDEFATTNPINHYGHSKLAGEIGSLRLNRQTYAIRTSWLFGHRPGSYVERILDQAERHGVVKMSQDQLEAPTYALHLAMAIERLVGIGVFGVCNITGGAGCTRAEFAEHVLRSAGRNEPVEVIANPTEGRIAVRPRRVVLDCRHWRLITDETLHDWQEGVSHYLRRRADRGDTAHV